MSDEDWWHHDGTIDWIVNPGGQIVELAVDQDGWVVRVVAPFMHRDQINLSSGSREDSFALFAALQDARPPAAAKALHRWKTKRAQRDHPAKGDT